LTQTPEIVELRVESDIVVCRQAVRRLTQSLNFSLVDQTRMITAASELARNTLVYGGGGEMRWAIVQREARAGLQLEFEDKGPGIPDLALALTDGWTSGGGMGLGLSGSKRLVHHFAIRSQVGAGTCVTITRWY
jgi:serine/threonine-protein kinase RsbT